MGDSLPLALDTHAIRIRVKAIIDSIKPLQEGFAQLADDDPLFNYGSGRPSPVDLDSLDALDLAMCIGEEFGLNNDEFERLVETDEGIQRLRTVNDITDLILSLTGNGNALERIVSVNPERKEVNA